MKHILIIEDDQELVELLVFHLKDKNFEVDFEYNGLSGFEKALSNNYDLIILDINLPGKNGLDICKELRMEKQQTPILMLTARTEEVDRILGLEFGADDYVCKPFGIRELIARIGAIFRRTELNTGPGYTAVASNIHKGELKIDVEKRKVVRKGELINLTPTEFNLLVLLASNPGKTYAKRALLDKVWGYEFDGFKHTVSSHINRLRNKIEKDPNEPRYILTTWGVGYRFTETW